VRDAESDSGFKKIRIPTPELSSVDGEAGGANPRPETSEPSRRY